MNEPPTASVAATSESPQSTNSLLAVTDDYAYGVELLTKDEVASLNRAQVLERLKEVMDANEQLRKHVRDMEVALEPQTELLRARLIALTADPKRPEVLAPTGEDGSLAIELLTEEDINVLNRQQTIDRLSKVAAARKRYRDDFEAMIWLDGQWKLLMNRLKEVPPTQ